MAIGLGGWAYLSAQDQIIGAILFSCGLLAVRLYKLNLFTGKIQFMVTKEYPWYFYPLVLFGNFAGVMIIAGISTYFTFNPAYTIAYIKYQQPFLESILKGIGCGMLMSLATYKETPLWITSLCVATFILAGFNHCIADFYYMTCAGFHSLSLVATIIGNIIGGIIFSEKLLHVNI